MAASASQSESFENKIPDWLKLPLDLTYYILSKLSTINLLISAQSVCSTWRSICKDPVIWHRIDMRIDGYNNNKRCLWPSRIKDMCRQAVDRSCGNLVYICIEYLGSDELLKYIADSSSSLRHLRLITCYEILNEGVINVFPRLSMLEQVEIFNIELTSDALEVIGRSCPLLKTFKYNQHTYRYKDFLDDTEAQAIATTMHELRHLHLFGNMLTNESLPVILDGCPYLEYLDLRWCPNVTLEGDIGKRCIEQIKDLRGPYDSTDDYEFELLWDGASRLSSKSAMDIFYSSEHNSDSSH